MKSKAIFRLYRGSQRRECRENSYLGLRTYSSRQLQVSLRYRATIKGTLHKEQITFSPVSGLPVKRFLWIFVSGFPEKHRTQDMIKSTLHEDQSTFLPISHPLIEIIHTWNPSHIPYEVSVSLRRSQAADKTELSILFIILGRLSKPCRTSAQE